MGPQQKKNTTGRCFFFAAAPRGRSLTHCGPGWCFALAGVVFFFFAAAPPGPGWCFFFGCGRTRTLTHSLWAGAISARPGWCFFLLRPRANAHSLTAGLGGSSHSPGWCFIFCCGPARTGWCFFFFFCGPAQTLTHSLWAGAISARPDGVFFFAVAPPGLFWLV